MKHLLRPVVACNRAPIQRRQQLCIAVGNQFDQVLVHCLLRGVGVRRRSGSQGGLGVAAARRRRGAQQRFRVVLDLLHLGIVDLAKLRDNMGRASVGAGGHGGHVRRLQQIESRRPCPRPGRRHVHNHRNSRTENPFDHGAHRVQQAARCIQLHQQRLRAIGVGLGNRPLQLSRAHRLDGIR